MTSVLQKIQSRGYWKVTIRPVPYLAERVDALGDLYPILQRCRVQLRGWDYPHLDERAPPKRYEDSIGQSTDWDQFVEQWRLYKSGQFVHVFGIREDWLDQSGPHRRGSEWGSGSFLWFVSTVYEYTEIFEFAARLAMSPAGDERTSIEVVLDGLEGRNLVSEGPHLYLPSTRPAEVNRVTYRSTLSRGELAADARKHALSASQRLFEAFHLDLSRDELKQIQDGLRRS